MDQALLCGMAQTAPERPDPLLRMGNTNCGGCGLSTLMQMLRRAVAARRVQLVIPASCAAVGAGAFPYSTYGAPTLLTTFASAAAAASGAASVAQLNGEDTRVICIAGDGGTYDIGFASLSAAAERNEDILYICYDNEIYGNTGGQRSSATPLGAITTTTPEGNALEKKDLMAILAAHRVPYAATVSLAHAEDALLKFRRALELRGFRFLLILSPCPTGWKSEPADGVELIRLAVAAGLFPVYEVEDGQRWRINVEPEADPAAAAEALARYFALQGRSRRAQAELGRVRGLCERDWRALRRRAAEV
jgi:pyruvate ferredoxin oxidoreductase beta subunit/2-oxoisovalerate ferredoxin oxidoreductase beta subunit